LEKAAFAVAKKDDDLKRVWTFVRSDFWFSDEVYGVKRALGALRLLGKRWHPDLPQAEAAAVQWLAEEAVAAVVVAAVRLAGDAYRQPPEVFERQLEERLAEGIAPFNVLRTMSKELDRYVMAVLAEAGVDPAGQLDRLGALDPKPPTYTESLVEVLHRLASAPHITAELPRLYDEHLASHRGSAPPVSGVGGVEAERGSLMLQTFAAFLRGQIRVPDDLMRPLLTAGPGGNGLARERAKAQGDSDGSKAKDGTPEPRPSVDAASPPPISTDDARQLSIDSAPSAEATGEVRPQAKPVKSERHPSASDGATAKKMPMPLAIDVGTTRLVAQTGTGEQASELRLAVRNESGEAVRVVGGEGLSPQLGPLAVVREFTLAAGASGTVELVSSRRVPRGEDDITVEVELHVRSDPAGENHSLRALLTGDPRGEHWVKVPARRQLPEVKPSLEG
jgi:hypothetical protein